MSRPRAFFASALVLVAIAAALALGYRVGRSARDSDAPREQASPARTYHCPMHPSVVSDQPGDCPICHMQLVPTEPDSGATGSSEHREAEGPPVAGLAPVTISDRRRQLIGVRTEEVQVVPFVKQIRAVGRVGMDETLMHHVHTKVPGWIEDFRAGAAGDTVREGDPLLTIYSPELLATQGEYLVALDNLTRVSDTGSAELRESAEKLLLATYRRLSLWDMTEDQIAELSRTRTPIRSVQLRSPVSGTIVSRNVSHGEKVEAVTSLLDIVDLSRVWVLADLYEYELPLVRQGQPATVTLSFLPGRVFRGHVDLVLPMVAVETRTVQLRVVLENDDLALKPGMFADVTIAADLGPRLAVSEPAVLRSGTRNVVFVDAGDGSFEPREIQIGLRLDDRFEVTAGLRAGERVVAAASFFVDAESRLDAALDAMGGSHPHP